MTADYPGSRWWRFDLHNHSPASSDYRGDKSITPREWLLDYMRAGIDAVAITDHNTAVWIDPLRAALTELDETQPAGYRQLSLFPGVELTAQDGLHVLAIFDPSTSGHTVAALLGSVGCREQKDNHAAMCEKGSLEILKAIHAAGAIGIAAHVDQVNGLYEISPGSNPPTLRFGARGVESLLQHFHALQIVDRSAAQLQSLLPDLSHRLALIAASDAHKASNAGRDSTWIKCGAPTLQGLRLALLDHQLAVRSFDGSDPNRLPTHWIRGLAIKDFRERRLPMSVRFNPGFNALIGGRGTGKSTLIESMRLALRRQADVLGLRDDGEVKRALERFAQVSPDNKKPGALRAESTCTIEYEREGECFRLSFDQSGRAAAVERLLETGAFEPISGLTPAQIAERWPARVLSQKQIFELASSPRALLNLVDGDPRLGKAEWQREFDLLVRRFKTQRAERRLVQQRVAALAVREDELAQINRKLKAFEQSNVGDELKAYQHAVRQRDMFEDRFMIAEALTRALDENLKRASFIRDGRLNEFAPANPAEEEASEWLQGLEARIRALPDALHQTIVDAKKEIEAIRQTLLQSAWKQQVDATVQGHAELVARMQSIGIESPKAYGLLALDKQRLERELLNLKSERDRLSTLDTEIDALRVELAAKRAELTQKRRAFIAQHIKASRAGLRQTVREMADKASAEAEIRDALGLDGTFGRDIHHTEGSASIGIVSDLHREGSVSQRWKRACEELDRRSPTVLGTALSTLLLKRLAEKTPEQFDDLLTRFPEDELILEYRQEGNYKGIDQGSAGQRSAAVLAFLLAFGDEPLIIDQPEDDLDNAMVYDLVVLGVRDNKARRQLIIATHNANIVVNGDAEYVIPMRYHNGAIDIDPGADGLQAVTVREKICAVMEGGRKALEMRYKKILKDLE